MLPAGWEGRVELLARDDGAIGELVAGRDKDFDFASALIRAGLINPDVMDSRAEAPDQPMAVIKRVRQRIERGVRLADHEEG